MVTKQRSGNQASFGIAASCTNDRVSQAVSKAILRFLDRIFRISVTSHYVTRAIQYLTVSTEGLSEVIVAIRAVHKCVNVVLTRHTTG